MHTLKLVPLIFGLLTACQADKADISENQNTLIDADGDGFPQGEDCDDSDSEVNPDMPELCDSIDNNCDGLIDEAVENLFYIDSDNDGFGTEGFLFEACEAPEGYVPVDGDCNDTDPLSYPGAEEICDGLDNDCDSEIDEDLLVTFYQDADGDSFGNPDVSIEDCLAPEGYVDNDDDCDDTNPDAYPGAAELSDPEECMQDADGDGYGDSNPTDPNITPGDDCDDTNPDVHPDAPEICDGIDNDCDGLIDDADPDIDYSYGELTLYPDNDGDGFGNANADLSSLLSACAPVEGYVTDNTDCDDTPITGAVIYPGAPETCDFIDNDCDLDIDEEMGAVAFFEAGAPVAVDLTSQFTGGPALPATPTLSSDGMLSLCEGTYYLNLTIESNVDIQTTGPVILDGAQQGSTILIDDINLDIQVQNLNIQNGYGSLGTSLNTPHNGGGVACRGAGTLVTLENVHFHNNSADLGGGLFLQYCDASLSDVSFGVNQAEWGGGMYSEFSSVTADGISFAENEAVTAGGGAYFGSSGTYAIENADWNTNTSTYGGGLYAWQVDLQVAAGSWLHNSADMGGGLLFYNGDLQINGSAFEGNTATAFGGALRLGGNNSSDSTTSTFDNSTMTNNSALYGGGAAVSEGSHIWSGSTLEQNTASFGGGMLIGEQDSVTQNDLPLQLTLSGTMLSANQAALGGAAYVRFGSELSCDGSTSPAGFELHSAPPQGGTGAIHLLTGGALDANQCEFGSGSQDNFTADVYLEQGSTQIPLNFDGVQSTYCTNLSCN